MTGDGNPGNESPSCRRIARSMSSSDMLEVIFVSPRKVGASHQDEGEGDSPPKLGFQLKKGWIMVDLLVHIHIHIKI